MTVKELAEALDGVEYPMQVQDNILRQAYADGLVIVHGGSDDLIEFEGAITDEAGCYGGGIVALDGEGIIPDFAEVEHEVSACEEWIRRHRRERLIEALWCKEPGYSWTYKTSVPHETFEVMGDGEHYCRGIVFALADLANPS